ncbi:hypothetical protein CP8484711_2108, partial [Chlamydia psittaci 84-8471/1]
MARMTTSPPIEPKLDLKAFNTISVPSCPEIYAPETIRTSVVIEQTII